MVRTSREKAGKTRAKRGTKDNGQNKLMKGKENKGRTRNEGQWAEQGEQETKEDGQRKKRKQNETWVKPEW